MRLRISPDVGIAMGMMVMGTGEEMVGQPAEMLACGNARADDMDAYERVLGDAMRGDATLFAREDYIDEAWRVVDPLIASPPPVLAYEPGTWGPKEVDANVSPPGGWHDPIMAP